MPIISPIQQKSKRGRIIIALMYLLLTLGAVTMVYPFLLLISGSVKSDVDIRDFDIFPKFFTDDTTLFRKFESHRYGDRFSTFEKYTGTVDESTPSYYLLEKPKTTSTDILKDWYQFLDARTSWPTHFLSIAHVEGNMTVAELSLKFKQKVFTLYPNTPKNFLFGDKGSLLKKEDWTQRSFHPMEGHLGEVFQEMRNELPLRYFTVECLQGNYLNFIRPKAKSEMALKELNTRWGTHYENINQIQLTSTPPTHPEQRKDWWTFVQSRLSCRFISFSPSLLTKYHDFLKTKYQTIKNLNDTYGSNYSQWEEIFTPSNKNSKIAFADLELGFLQSLNDPEGITLDGPDFRWQNFLKQKYKNNLNAFNQAHGTQVIQWEEIRIPTLLYDWDILLKNRREIIVEMTTRNYKIVWSHIAMHARALYNTVVFCGLKILIHLIINPLAAYALSRFQPRWGYTILFILMATMAFPSEVQSIPSFTLLRDLGWLNTFAALIIPSAANGYSIFLLKGFFDSLPKDLYESATLDGASELRIFLTITLPLSTPILAVIALNAFTSAYGAFMFALLVCQDESMWTIMVYIYQLQQMYDTPIVFASLVIAAIPTFFVFVFCQNIIMRGMVVPVEK